MMPEVTLLGYSLTNNTVERDIVRDIKEKLLDYTNDIIVRQNGLDPIANFESFTVETAARKALKELLNEYGLAPWPEKDPGYIIKHYAVYIAAKNGKTDVLMETLHGQLDTHHPHTHSDRAQTAHTHSTRARHSHTHTALAHITHTRTSLTHSHHSRTSHTHAHSTRARHTHGIVEMGLWR